MVKEIYNIEPYQNNNYKETKENVINIGDAIQITYREFEIDPTYTHSIAILIGIILGSLCTSSINSFKK